MLAAGRLPASLQTVLTRYARYVSQVLGEQVLAELREDFVGNALALPVGVVESAGSGDLLTRTSRDVDQLGWSVRLALPEWTIAVITAVAHLRRPRSASAGGSRCRACSACPPLVIGLRWYLARAKDGYLRESASYSAINATLTETVEGARTVEALGLGEERIRRDRRRHRASPTRAERYTLFLRTVFFPNMEIAYLIPTVSTLLVRRLALHAAAQVSLGDVTAATLYVQMLIDPVDRIVSILDELQMGAASLARLLGVAQVPDDREVSGAQPDGRAARRRRRAVLLRRRAATCCTASTSPSGSGERIAMVGPSGAGKSTLGRLLAGIHPPRTGVGHRRRRRAGRAAAGRPARPRRAGDPGAPRLRRHAAREPRAGRAPGRGRRPTSAARSPPSTRWTGSTRCPRASTRSSAPAAARSPPPRPSRSRWPGWCSPTRTRWCSTRPPR